MSTTTSSTTALPCSVCGELVSPGDLFCGSCGAAVGAGDSPGGRPRDLSDHNRNRNHRRTGQRVVAVIAGFVTVAAVSGLVVAFVDARRDLDKERKELTVANTRVAELTTQLDETA
ncbi:MAG: zinc ribbon domain-containing protein, partial [Ilumatobacteraceae bacterium]